MIHLSLVLSIFIGLLGGLYTALIFLSPQPREFTPSEKKFRSASHPNVPQELHDIRHMPGSLVDLSIIIPAFNEVPRLPSMISTAIKHLSKPICKGRICEFIIVDDGSSDGTSDKALELAQKYRDWDIKVVTLQLNMGKGGAVRHGMLYGKGRRLLMVDADGASRFEDLELLWREMDKLSAHDEPAIAIGSRAHLVKTDAVVKRSFVRNIAMYALHVTLRLAGVGHIRDTQCGFKLFSREAAKSIFPFQHLTGWIFDVEILLLAKYLAIPVAEIPITWSEVPESKLKLFKDSLLMFTDLMLLRANHIIGRWSVLRQVKSSDVDE